MDEERIALKRPLHGGWGSCAVVSKLITDGYAFWEKLIPIADTDL